jgi:hypothetical protein
VRTAVWREHLLVPHLAKRRRDMGHPLTSSPAASFCAAPRLIEVRLLARLIEMLLLALESRRLHAAAAALRLHTCLTAVAVPR